MNQLWLKTIIRFDARIAAAKQAITGQTKIVATILTGIWIIILELLLGLVSLPLYFFISTKTLKEQGASDQEVHTFKLRRKITFSVLITTIVLWLIRIFIGTVIVTQFFPTFKAHASTESWQFDRATDYSYDSSKVQIVDGVLLFKGTELPLPTPTEIPTTVPTVAPSPVTTSTALPTIEATPTIATTPIPTAVPTAVPTIEPTPNLGPLLWLGAQDAHASTNTCSTTVRPLNSLQVNNLAHWTGFSESAVKNGGSISYQLSIDDGSTWLFWNGSTWATAGNNNLNTVAEINAHISSLSTSTGHVMFKATLTSDCVISMTMLGVTVEYDVIPPSPTATPTLAGVISTVTSPLPSTIVAPVLDPTQGEIVYSNGLATGWLHPSYAVTNAVSDVTNTEKTFSGRSTFKLTTQNAGVGEFIKTFSTNGYDSLDFYIAGDAGADFGVSANILDTVLQPVRIRDYISRDVDGTFQKVSIPLSALHAENKTIITVAFTNLLHINSTIWIGDVVFVRGTAGASPPPEGGTPTPTPVEASATPSPSASPTSLLEVSPIATPSPLPSVEVTAAPSIPASIAPSITPVPEIIPSPSVSPTPNIEELNYQELLAHNTAPEVVITGAVQQGSGDVVITYNAKDAESNILILDRYEYSLTGQFAGEQQPLTQDVTNTDNDGTFTLTSTPEGITHHLVWHVSQDLANTQDGSVYVRLRPADSLVSGASAISAPFAIDTKGPQVTLSAPAQQGSSDTVRIPYTLSATNTASVALEISDDNGVTWTVPVTSATGNIGNTVSSGQHVITWDAAIDYNNQENSLMKARIVATDTFGNNTTSTPSSAFSVDTKAPFGVAALTAATHTTSSITWAWTPVSVEANFDHYELWYGTNQTDVENQTGTARKRSVTQDNDLGTAGTAATVTSNLSSNTLYYAQLVAVDTFGHTTKTTIASDTTGRQLVTPIAPILDQPIPTTTDTTITITGTAEASNSIAISVDSVAAQQHWATAGNLGQFSGQVDLTIGNHTITATATNNDGTSSASAPVVIEITAPVPEVTVEPTVATTIPSISPETSVTPEVSPSQESTSLSSEPSSGSNGIETSSSNSQVSETPASLLNNLLAIGGGGTTNLPLTNSTVETAAIIKDINRSRQSRLLPAPAVASVTQTPLRSGIRFSGKGVPGSDVVLFIFSDQAVMYHTTVKPDGNWQYDHDQNFVELKEGTHEVYAMTIEPGASVRSAPSFVKSFEVKRDFRNLFAQAIDWPTTLLTLLIVALAIWWFRFKAARTIA